MKKDIEELIFNEGTAWEFLSEWIKEASNKVFVLEPLLDRGKEILNDLQITNKSTLGSIAFQTGGMLVDNGWLKILGSGNEKICGDILTWNALEGTMIKHRIEGALIVAYDVIGGFFAINAGAFSGPIKQMYYFAPERLEWEEMEFGYTDFINWALNGNLSLFYENFRWENWEKDLSSLKGNEGFAFYPFLWSKEASDINKVQKSHVPIKEIWDIQQEFLKQME